MSGPPPPTFPSGGLSTISLPSANDFEISIKGASIIGGNLNIASGTIRQGTNPVTNISIDKSGKLTTAVAVPVASVASTSFVTGQIVIYTGGSSPAYALMVDDKSYKVINGFPFDISTITSGSGTASVTPDITFVLDATTSSPVIYTDLSLIKPAQITNDLQLRQYAILLANGYNDLAKDPLSPGSSELVFLTAIENLNIKDMSVADADKLIAAGKVDGIWTDRTKIPGIVNAKAVAIAPAIKVVGGSRRPRTARRRYRRRYSRRFRRY